MKPFSDFYRHILPYAPGVAGPSMDNALRNAAIEFCERTKVWQEYVTTSTEADNGTYDIETSYGTEPVKVMSMALDGRPLDHKTTDQLDCRFATWETDTGTPSYFTQVNPDEFILVPMPTSVSTDTLKYRVALKPTQTADNLADVLLSQHARDIAHGALAQLLLEPGATYSNPAMAAAYATMFENKMVETAIHVAKAFGRAPIRARGSYF